MADEVKTRDERIAELLEKSAADAVGSIKGPSLADVAPLTEKKEVTEDVADVEDDESNDKKVRIPRSRLSTLTKKIDELSAQVQESATYKERLAELEARLKENKSDDTPPDWWLEDYGNTPESLKGWKNQQRSVREEAERVLAEREARSRAEESAREARVEAIEQSFDDQMGELEESLGRELTITQKSELLDIIGEYSPQEDGQYVAYLSVSKAYDLWQKSQTTAPAKQEMARIAGASSSGSSQSQSSDRPQWGDWRKKYF